MEVSVTDYHTAGEPFRIVTSGFPEIVGGSVPGAPLVRAGFA